MIVALSRGVGFSFGYFSLSTFYLAWLTLGSIALLCLNRRWLNRQSHATTLLAPTIILLLVFVLIEIVGKFWIVDHAAHSLFNPGVTNRALAIILLGALVTAFFSLLSRLEKGAKAETQSDCSHCNRESSRIFCLIV